MKKLIPLFLLGFVIASNAQSTFNRANHNKNERAGALIGEMQGDILFLSHGIDISNWGANYINRYNASGALVSRNAVGYCWITKGIPVFGNRILFAGEDYMCDVPPQFPKDYLILTNAAGALVDSVSFFYNIKACAQTSDS